MTELEIRNTNDVVPVIVCDNVYAPYFSSFLSTTNGLLINSLDGVGNALVEVLSGMQQDSEKTLCILNTDSLSFDTLYYDYENDALYSKGIKATHVDTFFDNNNGFYANSGVYQTLFANTKLTLPNVGIYEIEPSVRDNPVGTNNALDSYRKWSTDAKKTKVIVHRKPIADFDLNIMLEYSNTYYKYKYLFDFQNRSYDLDHMSDANHGIVDYVLQYQKADRVTGEPLTDWIDSSMFSEMTDIIYRFGTGIYRINARLKVKDPEGAWSDYCEKDMLFLGYYVYSNLYATLRTDNPSNPLTAFRPGNYVEWYDIHFTDYYIFQDISNLNYYLEISLLDNGTPVPGVPVKKITDPSQIYDPQYRDHYWNNQKFYISDVAGLENKTYQVEIAAIIDDDMDGDYDRRISKIEDITLYANNPPTISASLSATSLRQGNDNTVWVNVNDPDQDNLLLNISVKKDDETYASKGYALSYPYVSTSLPLVDLDAGTYAVTATVSDGVESASKSLAFTVLPNTPPAVAVNVTSPYLFETDTNTAFVSVYDAEGDDLALDVTVLKDGTVYRTFSYNKTSPYTDEVIALSNLSAGTYTVRAFAADDYGNATATATFPVYVNSPPYITAEIASPEILDGDSNTLTTHLTDIDPQNLFVQTELYKEGVLYSRQNTTVAPVGGIYSDVLFTFPNLPIGSYLGQVAAWDGYATSNYVNYSFNVIPRNLPPSVTVGVTPETLFAGQKATVAMLFDDGDHEPLTVTLTVLKDGTAYDVSTFSVAWLGTQYEVIKKSYEGLPEGTYTVKAVVSDGTATDEDVKTFDVKPLNISAFEITGAWNHWDGRTDYRGVYLTPNTHRFLSLETVTFHASIKGLPEMVTVTLSPELMAMTYTDPYGVVYEYEELVGYDVAFPLALSMVSYDEASAMSTWEGAYLLPLAPSTLSWEDIRKRSPYEAELTASQELSSVKATIDDVEITGNIYDRISLQPVY
ncbi:hypothetical protein KHM83_12420 [Fusibacter paucivorans]|uniref:Ig-like domain (Group 3) n=1 Tax=Fusibacter paucivorans TaxID=76009 RepID=A0ABS5PT09_9FIRM|nr:hypothetical protein [Fusibacter paucivorans]MBS7527481.1 hypothetical protein [Fusibacter paucivorans]